MKVEREKDASQIIKFDMKIEKDRMKSMKTKSSINIEAQYGTPLFKLVPDTFDNTHILVDNVIEEEKHDYDLLAKLIKERT
jgi:hypothetical protein